MNLRTRVKGLYELNSKDWIEAIRFLWIEQIPVFSARLGLVDPRRLLTRVLSTPKQATPLVYCLLKIAVLSVFIYICSIKKVLGYCINCSLSTDTSSKFGLLLRLESGNTLNTCSIPVRTCSIHRDDVRCWIDTLTTVYYTRSRTSIGPADHSASDPATQLHLLIFFVWDGFERSTNNLKLFFFAREAHILFYRVRALSNCQ